MGQNNSGLFFGAIAVAIIGVLLCVYYLIPGVNHLLVSGSPLAAHYKHAAAFAALAVIGIIGALVTRPKATAK
jgi:hypothetical protein